MYPSLTPYQFAGNTPIWAKDLEGLEPWYSTQPTDAGNAGMSPTQYGPLSPDYASSQGLSGDPSYVMPDAAVVGMKPASAYDYSKDGRDHIPQTEPINPNESKH